MAKKKKPTLREVVLNEEPLLASHHFPAIKPSQDRQMPLSAALHWIASRGFRIDHDLTSQNGQLAYRAAAIDLFAKISSGKVCAVGENSEEDPEHLPAVLFGGLTAYFDFVDDFEAAGHDRRMMINVSENHKSRDILMKASNRGKWTDVYVFCDGLLKEWKFDVAASKAGSLGKRPKLFRYFAKTFEGNLVPPPSEMPRTILRADLLKWDPLLAPLDEGTVTTAVKAYNEGLLPK